MASKTVDTGNGGTWQIVIDQVSQSQSGNYSKVRVRGILKNTGSSTTFINDPVATSINGSASYDGSAEFNLSGGESATVIDKTFNIDHNSAGEKTVTFSINMANTGTYTIGDPPTLEHSLELDRIPKVPTKIDDLTRSFDAPTTVNLDWTAPANNGASITGYDVQWDSNSSFSSPATSTGTASSKSVTGLGRGNTYWFRVRATNSAGDGAWSSSVSYAIPNVPDPVPAPACTFNAPTSVFVDWVAPDSGGATITQYDLQYDDNSSFSSPTTVTNAGGSRTVTGLAIAKTWYFRVRALNSQGTGAWGPAKAVAIPNIPGTPAVPTLAFTAPTTMKISWALPTNGGAAISGYDVQYSTSSTFASGVLTVSTTALNVTVTNLTVGSTWYFRVRAKNSQGAGAYSPAALYMVVAGPRIRNAGVWKNSVAYVKVDGVWKVAIPYVKVAGVWKIAGG